MNQLKTDKRKAVIAALVEGSSINSTVRLTGVAKTTILRLLAEIGPACARFHDDKVRGLDPLRVECDETWSFCGMKQKNVPEERLGEFGYGDVWTWAAIDPMTRLLISYHIGTRSQDDANIFMDDLAGRVLNIGTLSTDGLYVYPDAVREAFGEAANHARILKVYQKDRDGAARYSPAYCIGCKKVRERGRPDMTKASTSLVERLNLSIRTNVKRYARLTLAHSRKIENHRAAFSLFTVHYNFCRKHMSLGGKTPAMAAGLTDHVWTIDELIGLIR